MSCPHHSGPSRWRVTFTPARGVSYVFDCWSPTREGAIRETRRDFKARHPGLAARKPEVQELCRRR